MLSSFAIYLFIKSLTVPTWENRIVVNDNSFKKMLMLFILSISFIYWNGINMNPQVFLIKIIKVKNSQANTDR